MFPKSIRLRHLALAAMASIVVTLAGSRAHAGSVHLALVKSAPVNAAKLVTSPKAIELWFSQKPNLKLTRIVLTSAKHDTLMLRSPALADTSGKHVSASLVADLPVGNYDVSWRTLSRDGHAVAGKFSFMIDSVAMKGVLSGSSSTARKPR